MEDVALGLSWITCIDEMHPLSTLDIAFYTLDVGLDDDVMC
jgi:hypothetical protein